MLRAERAAHKQTKANVDAIVRADTELLRARIAALESELALARPLLAQAERYQQNETTLWDVGNAAEAYARAKEESEKGSGA